MITCHSRRILAPAPGITQAYMCRQLILTPHTDRLAEPLNLSRTEPSSPRQPPPQLGRRAGSDPQQPLYGEQGLWPEDHHNPPETAASTAHAPHPPTHLDHYPLTQASPGRQSPYSRDRPPNANASPLSGGSRLPIFAIQQMKRRWRIVLLRPREVLGRGRSQISAAHVLMMGGTVAQPDVPARPFLRAWQTWRSCRLIH